MIELFRKLDPNWVAAIASVVGVIVTILVAIEPPLAQALEIDWKEAAWTIALGFAVSVIVGMELRRWIRWWQEREKR
uniref:Uncharacterized protein n=1 Tax=Candidatus Kentrum sp. FM TaxID=2126340 RepID=A0A450SKW3_9GAMM|nr:MAG: hypothetical protein BECKFM1743A_GA0114220_100184 [Candidatus Kentron sp. FM]VFJ54185.1 MAG: hypothetical protein BECKFM1743C_GA0114222_101354 [Candidatus Kentron sp. FM]VFK10184.1 MAG: hypothetical protein BECKFM1743B_GA0114221_101324 [Candidatus Kentron sp. FM]